MRKTLLGGLVCGLLLTGAAPQAMAMTDGEAEAFAKAVSGQTFICDSNFQRETQSYSGSIYMQSRILVVITDADFNMRITTVSGINFGGVVYSNTTEQAGRFGLVNDTPALLFDDTLSSNSDALPYGLDWTPVAGALYFSGSGTNISLSGSLSSRYGRIPFACRMEP